MTVKGLRRLVVIITVFAIVLLVALVTVNIVLSVEVSYKKEAISKKEQQLKELENYFESIQDELEYREGAHEQFYEYYLRLLGYIMENDVVFVPQG